MLAKVCRYAYAARAWRFLAGPALLVAGSINVAAQETERMLSPDSMFFIKASPDIMQVQRDLGGGVHEWKTASGIRFLLYPFANPEQRISIHELTVGGFFRQSENGLMEETIALPYIWAADLGKGREPKELGKMLRGRMHDLHRFIGPYNRGFTLETQRNDLELALQVWWLQVTEGRLQRDAYSAYVNWINTGRPGTPADAFRDTIRLAMTRSHPLVVKGLTFRGADLDTSRLRGVVDERFRWLSGSTVVIAGDFSLDTIRPLLEMYFGFNVSSKFRFEEMMDVGIRPPSGIVRRTVSGRTDGRTLTRLEFYDSVSPTQVEFEQVNVLRDLLDSTLTRELASNADSVSVHVDWVRTPEQSYRFTVEFLTKPTLARSAVTTALTTIRLLQSDSISTAFPAGFETARNQLVNEFKSMMTTRSPDVVRRLQAFDAYRWPLAEIASDSVRRQVTLEQVRAVAQKFLDLKNYGHFTMTPSSSSSSSSTSKVR